MAALTLNPSELERRRLRATKAQLDQRWVKLGDLLRAGLDAKKSKVAVDAEYQASGVWTGLRGAGVERISRNRGVATVAPLAEMPGDLAAWLGYQEVWELESGRAPYAFRQASLTVHIGDVGDPWKPQLMRLEWPGLRDWDRSGIGFQSAGAGHPHWQIDLFESLRADQPAPVFDPDGADEVEDFGQLVAGQTLPQQITSLTYEKMHLASAAPWWSEQQAEFGSHHLNAPKSDVALSRWVSAAVSYIRQELSRCGAAR